MTTITAQHAPAHDLNIDLDADPFEDLDYEDYLDEIRAELALTTAAAPLFVIPTIELDYPDGYDEGED